nr:MAG: RNA-dependent RNA polymerase [Wufeng shrew dicistrovirus 2]
MDTFKQIPYIHKNLIKDLVYKRNHPFYPEWHDWLEVCTRYNHCRSKIMMAHSMRSTDYLVHDDSLTGLEEWTVGLSAMERDSIYWNLRNCDSKEEWNKWFYERDFHNILLDKCTCYDAGVPTLRWNYVPCNKAKEHRQAHIVGFINAYWLSHTPRRSLRKYYKRLIRVVFSLSEEKVNMFTPDLVTDPPRYQGRGRFLLRELYTRAYFDEHKKSEDFACDIEFLKNFVKQQSGPTQCPEADCFDEMIKSFISLNKKFSFKSILNGLKPVQQGFFNITHKHEHVWADADFSKLKGTIQEAQDNFLSGMKQTILNTAKNLSIIFITASTVSLLAKLTFNVGALVILKLLHFIYAFVCGVESHDQVEKSMKACQQSFMTKAFTIPFLPAMILEYVIGPPKNMLKRLWQSPDTDRVMRRIGYLGDVKIEKGIDRVVEWIKVVIRQVQQWYYSQLGIPYTPNIDDCSHEIIKWNESVDELLEEYYKGTFVWCESSWSMIYKLYSTGLKFTRSQCYSRYKNDVWRVVSKLANILELFKTHQRSGTSIRNPPVTIYLAGGTGVGKSSLTYPLAAEILKGIFEAEGSNIDLEKHWQEFIYMRSSEQEYWDGYENQLVTVFDDFSQLVDSSSNPNLELFEIIRASNCFPYPLHMAALDQKANTNFTSKIILVSSNLEKPDSHSLNFPTALHRRFDICVKVERTQESKTRNLTEFDPTVYKFTRYDMATGNQYGSISYKNLIDLGVTAYQGRKDYVDSIHGYIQKQLKRPEQPLIDVEVPVVDEFEIGSLGDDLIAQEHIKAYQQAGNFALVHGNVVDVDNVKVNIPIGMQFSYYKNKILSYFNRNPWEELRVVTQGLKFKYRELQEQWVQFKEKHPYLSKVAITVTLITTGLMFLKIFFSVKKMIQPEKQRFQTPEEFVSVAESYSPVVQKVAKREAYEQPKPHIAKRESAREIARKTVESELASEQGVKDLNAAEVLMKMARSNLYKMYLSENKVAIGHVIFLVGKVALMPRHYLDGLQNALKLNPNASVYFEAVVLKRSFETRVDDLLKTVKTFESPNESDGPVYSRDLMAVSVSNSIMHADSCCHFVSRSDLSRVDNTSVMLPVLVHNGLKDSERPILLLRFSEGRSQLARQGKLDVYDEEGSLCRYVRDVWEYNMDTQATECGAPLIVRNTLIKPGKICGIHIAGIEGTGQGFSTPVYKEDLKEILSSFPDYVKFAQQRRLELKEFPVQQGQVPQTAEFIRLGSINKPLAQPGVSKIEPSLVHATYKQPETKPCALRPVMVDGERFDPRSYRIERLGNMTIPLREDMIEYARDAFVDEVSQVIVPNLDVLSANIKSVYTFEEAVLGIDGEIYVNSIKRDTSPGFPFVQIKGQSNRKQFFGVNDEYDLTSPECKELKLRVLDIIENARKGIVLDHYFMDTLKDERKPIHKAHKTRLFAAGPMDYLIACKMYFNGVVAIMQHNRNWSHVSVGTNPYSLDWGEIVSTLRRKSENMIAGDFEGFDASQHMLLLEAAGEALIQISKRFLFSTEEDVRIMRVLMVSLINSMHISGSEVYQWTHSLPSGHYLTAMINSVFVNLAFACVWQINKNEFSYRIARLFWQECGIVAYGDDHIVSVPDYELKTFNQESLVSLFQKIGLSYTMEDKDAKAEQPSRLLTEVSYLKRGFRRDKQMNRWVAPLSMSTILETPMWIHKSPDPRLQTVSNLEWALKELSLHSEETWNEWSPKLRQQCERLGQYTIYKDRDYTKRVCLDQDLIM